MLRTFLFDHGFLEQRKAPCPVISVGNLAMGGTGKTPMVEHLINITREAGLFPVVISRGYRRRTRGPLPATPISTASDIGDEPLQIYRKYQGLVPVIVSEDRRKALPYLPEAPEGQPMVILLDDAFQHRYLQRDCNILLTAYHRLYTRDHVLPFGRLRESRKGARRADIIIVTKCPADLSTEEAEAIRKELAPLPSQHLFFSTIEYAELPPKVKTAGHTSLITGIAHPEPLLEYLAAQGIKVIKHLRYPDHHRFSAADLATIRKLQLPALTTEKDAARLPDIPEIYALPIQTHILFNESENLNNIILNLINSHPTQSSPPPGELEGGSSNMLAKIRETAAWLQARTALRPEIAIVLGSGLGNLAKQISVVDAFEYKDIPHFPVSTVEGHHGRLLFGHLAGRPVMAMEGRFHYYEGYDMKQVTFPERVMHQLGITTFIVSNAAGGMNPNFHVGDIMLIADHINLFPEHPLRGQNLPTGPRFPDMHEAYDHTLLQLARDIAAEQGTPVQEGVYLGVSGPTFETPAEYRAYWRLGADAVGMSTVPEVIVARHSGMRCFGISIITDLGGENIHTEVSHEEVQQAAQSVEAPLARLITEFVARLK